MVDFIKYNSINDISKIDSISCVVLETIQGSVDSLNQKQLFESCKKTMS